MQAAKLNAQLKLQIAAELMSKKQCAYEPYKCSQTAMKNYNYCQQHILSDKTAPYRQCSYMYNGGKHCHHPAYKSSKKEGSFCNEHALKAHLFKAKQGTRMQPPKNAESILSSLSHYVMKPKAPNQNLVTSSTYRNSDDGKSSPDFADAKVTKALDPLGNKLLQEN